MKYLRYLPNIVFIALGSLKNISQVPYTWPPDNHGWWRDNLDEEALWLHPSDRDNKHKQHCEPLLCYRRQWFYNAWLECQLECVDTRQVTLVLNGGSCIPNLAIMIIFDCYCPGLNFFTRFGLLLPSPSHSWPTLHSPWSPGLPLRESHWRPRRHWQLLLWPMWHWHDLCSRLDHWIWTLAANALYNLSCRRLWHHRHCQIAKLSQKLP